MSMTTVQQTPKYKKTHIYSEKKLIRRWESERELFYFWNFIFFCKFVNIGSVYGGHVFVIVAVHFFAFNSITHGLW